MIPKIGGHVSNVTTQDAVCDTALLYAPLVLPQTERPMTTHERRRYPRYDVGKLPGVLDGFRTFETLKISAGGALIRLPAELALEQRVHVSFDIGDGSFESSAVVVFVGPDVGAAATGLFRVGLAFVDADEAHLARLQRFIDKSIAAGALK